jgi:hypothetical protein
MRFRTTEDLVITQIENGIRGIKLGTKNPQQIEMDKWFNRLETLNKSMCDELLIKYQTMVNQYKQKENKHNGR